jgi:hypothetical protein
MSGERARATLYWGGLLSLWVVVSACEGQDSYLESHGRGTYRIVSHEAFPACAEQPQLLSDDRCIQVLPTLDGLWLQNCDAVQEQLELDVELAQQGHEYGLSRTNIERCVDYCAGGISPGAPRIAPAAVAAM